MGALIGFGAAILGSIIPAIISYKISKLQINARRDDLSLQQNYNEQQARIDRLIKLREGILIPLKEVMSKWIQASILELQMIVRLKTAHERKDNPADIAREDKLWVESSDIAQQVAIELAVLQGKLSDSTLDKMIDIAKEAFWETSRESQDSSNC